MMSEQNTLTQTNSNGIIADVSLDEGQKQNCRLTGLTDLFEVITVFVTSSRN